MKATETIWPPVEAGYIDEYGPIEPEVYQAAGALWSQAERFAVQLLHDAPAGLSLMLKAAALVSRKRAENPGQIANIRAYLFQTYKRLVLAEMQKENGHEAALEAGLEAASHSLVEEVDRKILVEQIVRRMDRWTRQVFEWLTLGHTFEEIGQALGKSPPATRNKFRDQLNRLMKQIEAEIREGK